MDTNTPCVSTCSASTSTPAASSSSTTADAAKVSGRRTDQIVKIELEAAEVLAGLAHSSMLESCESGGKWGHKGKRARKRVKHESPASVSDKKPNFSVPMSSDLAQDRAVLEKQQCEELCRNLKIKTVKAEQAELHRTTPMCSKTHGLLCGSRSRQNLTEAEKEERRIRRILANRESARQTIRRRQAICDELTRKAVDLSLENENLKKEKELTEKEYESLKNINEYLKEQMAKPIKSEEVETSREPSSTHVEIAASPSTSSSLLLCNPPSFTPFVWPFIIQSPNHIQIPQEPQNAIVVSPKVLVPSKIHTSNSVRPLQEPQNAITISPEVVTPSITQSSNPVQLQDDPHNSTVLPPRAPVTTVFGNVNSSHEQENPVNVNGSKTPICLLPYHWFFHLPDHGVGLYHQPSFSVKLNQGETTVNDNDTNNVCSSSQTLAQIENHHSSSPIQLNREAYSFKEARPAYNLNETPVGFPPDGGGQQVEACPKGMIFKPTPISPVISAVSTKHENGHSQVFPPKEATSSTDSHTANPLPRKNEVSILYPSKTAEDVVAAAEARKRRKELTRLKNLRPFRINC